MDEATANIDIKTEETIQNLINTEFKDSTVITVAHRLNTIKNSDKIAVMSYGEIIEFDTPQNLQQDESSEYYSLLQEFNK
jgi:ABC-type multidrug transport system fused ATPase/permease subunit